MRGTVPRVPLYLGLAGLIPFVWGAVTLYSDTLAALGSGWFGPRFVGPYVQLAYGSVILAFMSGVLWGFATRADAALARSAYGLSVIPALWVFLVVGGGPTSATIYLLAGFVGLLGLDWLYWKQDLAPHWWFRFRLMLTIIVAVCLLASVAALGG